MIELAAIGATAVVNVAVTLAVIRLELRHMREAINAAHRRLDKINAPPAGGDVLPTG